MKSETHITKTVKGVTHPIRTLDDWKTHACPKSQGHWVKGRSAKECARAWIGTGPTPQIPKEIESAILSHPDFHPIQQWHAEPEAKLWFDEYRGEPRNTDMAVEVTDQSGKYLLAIEAKADETFGRTITQQRVAAEKAYLKNPKSCALKRIDDLEALFAPGIHSDRSLLRYQLFTAVAGALTQRSYNDCERRVLFVHVFQSAKPEPTEPRNLERNAEDLNHFINALSGGCYQTIANGQLVGPIPNQLTCRSRLYIGKATREINRGDPL